jgi:preprotein translocase SecE subunit
VPDDEQPLAAFGAGDPMSTAASAFGGDVGTPSSAPSASERSPRGLGRVTGFLRASWAELQRVEWPDRRQVGQATGVVLGFVVLASIFLGLADTISQSIVNAIL